MNLGFIVTKCICKMLLEMLTVTWKSTWVEYRYNRKSAQNRNWDECGKAWNLGLYLEFTHLIEIEPLSPSGSTHRILYSLAVLW